MPYSFDFIDGNVYRWEPAGEDGSAEYTVDESYHPRFYVDGPAGLREEFAAAIAKHPSVVGTEYVERRLYFGREPESVLAVDVTNIDAVVRVARQTRQVGLPGDLRCFNVDFSREFRYCLEREFDPSLNADLSILELSSPPGVRNRDDLPWVELDGERVEGSPRSLLEAIDEHVRLIDPDILLVDTAALVPKLYEMASRDGLDFALGRGPYADTYQQLAGESTYHSYGRIGHSPARYNVPGRVLIDRSNSFFLRKTNLAGCLDLVERSGKPLQEQSWASIGNVLTAMQIREATRRNVLVQWRAWRPETWKSMRTLHAADRGGYTFAPRVGVHNDVHELDFSSLYPNIIVTRNVSPDTIRCDCCDGDDVPELGYTICERRGYLADVLEPLISDRDELKREIRETDDEEYRRACQGKSDAIKWVLVSCFGYQGFSNAKFGRIECHEAINAFARKILIEAKDTLEAAGWDVVHGIVDSLWVTAAPDCEQRPLEEVAAEITEDVGIRLEYEGAFDWIAFVPQRHTDTGALTKYFGKYAEPQSDGTEYKYRGIECRQRSTPSYLADVQEELIKTYDQYRAVRPVIDHLAAFLEELRSGSVEPSQLCIRNRVSKAPEEYSQATRSVAALKRAGETTAGIPSVGSDVEYVVVDDKKRGRERVTLAIEDPEQYDVEFYADEMIRAAESVLSPLGWRQNRIKEALSETEKTTLGRW